VLSHKFGFDEDIGVFTEREIKEATPSLTQFLGLNTTYDPRDSGLLLSGPLVLGFRFRTDDN